MINSISPDYALTEVAVEIPALQGCACPLCAAPTWQNAAPVQDGAGIAQLDGQGFLLDVSSPDSGLVGTVMPNGLRILTATESAIQIARPSGTWANLTTNLEVTYSFDAGRIGAGYAAFDAAYQSATREILSQYADLTLLTFREVTGGSAPNIQFQNITGQFGGGGWANYPSSGVQYNSIGYPWDAGDIYAGSYVYLTMVHEIGHSLGLAHPGNYNGSNVYPDDSVVWNDSAQYSVMSYNGEGTTGGWYAGAAATPMLHDVLALQIEYGFNWGARAGDTTYGYNSNTGLDSFSFDSADNTSAFTIWDGAGRDTLDFSGFVTNGVMDLRQGGFSSSGVEAYNVAIAYYADIENAIGGAGDDAMRGNVLANEMLGGAGRDVIYGGADGAPVIAPNPRDFIGIALNQDVMQRGQYLSIANVTALSGPAFSVEMLVEITRVPASFVALMSYAVSGNSNEFILGGNSDGTLTVKIDGLADYDTGILTRSLVNGAPHRVSTTWNSASGEVALYIDGALAHAGIYTAAIGRILGASGMLIVGQEQDSFGGGFNAGQVLQGTVGDIRIFTDLRTAGEIAASAFAPVAPDAQGLVHNWQAQLGDSAALRDVATANPAINLTDLMPDFFAASQSSVYSAAHAAANVLDNSLASQNHTNAGANEWLKIDFDAPLLVTRVEVQNVTGWGARLNGATVSVLDAQGAVLHTFAPISGEGYFGNNLSFTLPGALLASAVRIDHHNQNLHVSEVNIFGTAPAGVAVPAPLLSTDMTIHGGAVAASTAPIAPVTYDDDTLIGGAGQDQLFGGYGNDSLIGDGAGTDMRAANDITLVRLNGGLPVSGTTDQWLDQTAAFPMPTTALTLEMVLRLDENAANGATIFGYANGGDSNIKRFTLRAWSDYFDFYFLDNTLYNTRIPAGALTGAGAVRLSVTWDSASGLVTFYLNGAQVDQITVPIGATLTSGYQVFAMSGNASTITGAVGDIRIWDHARSMAEIAADAFVQYGDAPARAGLVANWQADGSGAVLDNKTTTAAVADLVVQNVTAANPLAFEVAEFTKGNDDTLSGGFGDDTLAGGIGDDSLIGGAGNDLLDGGAGGDTLTGGLGDDRYVIDDLADLAIELAGQGADTIETAINYRLGAVQPVEFVYATGSAGLTLSGNKYANGLYGNGGNDVLSGAAGNDTLNGGAGNDALTGGAGADHIIGGAGLDRASYTTSLAAVTVDLFAGTGAGGDAGGDVLQGVEHLTGSAHNDTLAGDRLGNGFIGGAGNDVLIGAGGRDTLSGGTGADTLNGGTSGDFLTGGAGADVFQFDLGFGIDQIKDFEAVDSVILSSALWASTGAASVLDFLTNHAVQVSTRTELRFTALDIIRFENTALQEVLDAQDHFLII